MVNYLRGYDGIKAVANIEKKQVSLQQGLDLTCRIVQKFARGGL